MRCCLGTASVVIIASAALAEPIEPGRVRVIDGDTIAVGSVRYELVGFDAPEIADEKCARRAASRLRALIASGGLTLGRVSCSCRPGTEGRWACNYGRLCATLKTHGRDVGEILIAEGHAVPYRCGKTRCPRPMHHWCAPR